MSGNEVSLVRAIRGPVTLITVGALFALNNFTPYEFNRTWPILLIVFGLLSLLRRGTEPPRRPYPGAAAPPYYQPPVTPGTDAGSFRQSPYQEASGPSKGGFGSSAAGTTPPRDPNQNPGGSV